MFSLWTTFVNLLTRLVTPVLLWFGGRASARADAAESAADNAKKGNEIDEDVRDTTESDLDDELRGD